MVAPQSGATQWYFRNPVSQASHCVNRVLRDAGDDPSAWWRSLPDWERNQRRCPVNIEKEVTRSIGKLFAVPRCFAEQHSHGPGLPVIDPRYYAAPQTVLVGSSERMEEKSCSKSVRLLSQLW